MTDDLMTPQERAFLEHREGATYVAWEYFDRWLRKWRDETGDVRDDLELIEVYSAWCATATEAN